MKKFIRELHSDLEVVYVGQMCLTWEFLHWQYVKALSLWDSDPHGIRHYNEVAGEFQQFQVLLQRFIEDEPFQGPRVQHYSNSRCAFRNLLQVPVIREDRFKDKCKARKKKHTEENFVTSDMLVEIVGESIRIFWQFVEADKDCNIETKRTPELHDPEDLQLLIEIRKILQKKERKLKDIVRGER
ncbi:Ribosomal L34Ae, partial [Olea europaea subsp. europaea]